MRYRFRSERRVRTRAVETSGGYVKGDQLRHLIREASGMNRLSKCGYCNNDRLEMVDEGGVEILDTDVVCVHTTLIVAMRLAPVESKKILYGATPPPPPAPVMAWSPSEPVYGDPL